MVGNFKSCIVCEKSIELKQLAAHHDLHIQAGGIKVSSESKDFVVTECAICYQELTLNKLRNHTIKAHGIPIGKYKAQHSVAVAEKLFHQCHICNELMLHDYDTIGTHLAKHKEITHKEYNERFMQRMKPGRQAKQNDSSIKAKQRKMDTGKDLLASAMEMLDLPSPTSPFTSPMTAGRRSIQWLSHQELHLAEWPHQECNEQAGIQIQVLDAEGLQITVG